MTSKRVEVFLKIPRMIGYLPGWVKVYTTDGEIERVGINTALWATRRVAENITRLYGTNASRTHISEINSNCSSSYFVRLNEFDYEKPIHECLNDMKIKIGNTPILVFPSDVFLSAKI